MRAAVLVFPGTTGEGAMYQALRDVLAVEAELVWYEASDLSGYDAIFLPGGASYGDYLRPGALASRTPVMAEVKKAAEAGKPVVGVGNGFQILLEAGLLPGAVLKNESLLFHSATVELEVVSNQTMFTKEYTLGERIFLPVAHGYGNYYCDQATLAKLEANQQIVFRYRENVNGSVAGIAGLVNQEGNVLGMMPHPERAVAELLGSTDGKKLFTSILADWREKHAHV